MTAKTEIFYSAPSAPFSQIQSHNVMFLLPHTCRYTGYFYHKQPKQHYKILELSYTYFLTFNSNYSNIVFTIGQFTCAYTQKGSGG
jgi:hypothetical protein